MNLQTADIIINEYREAIGDYRSYNAVNFSTLSQLAKDPRFVNIEQKDTSYFIFGRFVEDLFMGENTSEKYTIIPSNLQEPVGQMLTYANYLIEEKLNGNPDAEIYAYERVGFKRDSLEKVQTRYQEEAKEYVEFHINAEGKSVISAEEALLGSRCATGLRNHVTVEQFIDNPSRFTIHYQVPLIAKYEETTVKCLVDMLVVDNIDNVIYPIDVKTTSKRIQEFSKAAKQYRYDLQASLYSYIISTVFGSYKIHNFSFLVVSKELPDVSKMFITPASDIYAGRFGVISPTGFKYKGWQELTKEYLQHVDMDYWELPVEYFEPTVQLNIHYNETTALLQEEKQI